MRGGEEEAAEIRRSSARVLIYMSCGHEAFMADADRLTGVDANKTGPDWGPPFRLASMTCYDMFPFTSHIETLGIFVRAEPTASAAQPSTIVRPAKQRTAGESKDDKLQCQFYIGIENEPGFRVNHLILGRGGQNMKNVAERTGAKVRLRGRGSGFKEGPARKESDDPLMLCVSAADEKGFAEAQRLLRELLEDIYKQFREFCSQKGRKVPMLEINVHQGPRPGSRSWASKS